MVTERDLCIRLELNFEIFKKFDYYPLHFLTNAYLPWTRIFILSIILWKILIYSAMLVDEVFEKTSILMDGHGLYQGRGKKMHHKKHISQKERLIRNTLICLARSHMPTPEMLEVQLVQSQKKNAREGSIISAFAITWTMPRCKKLKWR